VNPPWNFPLAIPIGGIAAILAAGNCAIMKPASAAALTAYELCKCFWSAGVSKNTLQYVPCPGSLVGEHLLKNESVDFVILTCGEKTAYKMLSVQTKPFHSSRNLGKRCDNCHSYEQQGTSY